jgi:hypothetical protein
VLFSTTSILQFSACFSVFFSSYFRYKINVKRREKALKCALETVSSIIHYMMQ